MVLIPSHQMLVAVATALEPGGVNRAEIGVEDLMYSMVAVRIGYQASLANNQTGGATGLAVGAGFLYRGFTLDYAFLPYGDLGQAQRISLTYDFGGI
jgi:hypothetical protein